MTADSTLDPESFQNMLASAFVVQQSLIDVQLPSAILMVRRLIAAGDMDVNGVVHLIAGRAQNVAHATGAAIGLLKGDQLVYRAGSGSAATFAGLHLTAILSVSAKTKPDNEILRVEDAETDVGIGEGICRQFGAKSLLILPIYHEQMLGVLQVFFDEAHAFQDEEVRAYQSMASVIAEVMTSVTKVGPKKSLVLELSTMPAIQPTVPPLQGAPGNSGSLANNHSICHVARPAIAESGKLQSGRACSAAAIITDRAKRFPWRMRMWKVADLAAVIIVLVTASWIAYNDGRPSLPTEGVVAPQRSNTGTQQGPTEVGSVKKGFSIPLTASIPMKEVRKAARSTPRPAKVGEYEIDYISEDVTVHHFTSKPALQQAPTRDDQVEYVSEDVTVRHFAPKLAVVSPRQPVVQGAAVRR
jgi:hypothetical protein